MDNLNLELPNILIAQAFIIASFFDLKGRHGLLGLVKAHNVPFPTFSMYGGILVKLVCGLGLLYVPTVTVAAYGLIIFTFIANVIFHPFWKKPKERRDLECVAFLTTIALIGGLLSLIY